MHGVKRHKESEEERLASLKKIEKYKMLMSMLSEKRASKEYSEESLNASAAVLTVNADFYTAWSFRRQVIQHLDRCQTDDESAQSESNETSQTDASPENESKSIEQRKKLLDNELGLGERLLQRHPKSYWIWFHRRWVLQRLATVLNAEQMCRYWQRELDLCARFLNADKRNFHCWNYRRWAADVGGVHSIDDELAFTSAKIEQDFSNYSAWQHRARLFGERVPPLGVDELDDEFELVRQAFYTEPDDSSAWFYHRWLLAKARELHAADGARALMERELECANELLEEEPDSKWALLCTVDLMQRIDAAASAACIAERIDRLQRIDSNRRLYYESLLKTD
jgi:geranylgeranyl transferase type-2 subunit alpha